MIKLIILLTKKSNCEAANFLANKSLWRFSMLTAAGVIEVPVIL